jgi:Immunity protein 17
MQVMLFFMNRHVIEATLLALGLVTLLASVRNWNFLFDHSGRDVLAGVTSRLGSRIVYGTLGGVMTLASLVSAVRSLA